MRLTRKRQVFGIAAHFPHHRFNVRNPVVASGGAVLGLYFSDVGQALHDVVPLHVLADGIDPALPRIEWRIPANVGATTVAAVAIEPIPRVSRGAHRSAVALTGGKTGLGAGNSYDQTRIDCVLLAIRFEDLSVARKWRRPRGSRFSGKVTIDRIAPRPGSQRRRSRGRCRRRIGERRRGVR
jgi:hypothetical protein